MQFYCTIICFYIVMIEFMFNTMPSKLSIVFLPLHYFFAPPSIKRVKILDANNKMQIVLTHEQQYMFSDCIVAPNFEIIHAENGSKHKYCSANASKSRMSFA